MVRRALIGVCVVLTLAPAAYAQEAAAVPPVDVIDISGPLDARAIESMIDMIEHTDAQAVVLQLNSPAALSHDIERLLDLVADPPRPVVTWVGTAPARAQGGVGQLLLAAPLSAAAPETLVGYLLPTVAGDAAPSDDEVSGLPPIVQSLLDDVVEVDAPIPGLVDLVVPSIGQLVVGLDGMEFSVAGGTVVLDTAEAVENPDGVSVLRPTAQVRFSKGGLFDRALRLAIRPEAAFFFLVAGLSLAVFEFYAAGVGVMAVVAALALFLAGYGMSVLPMRWSAVVATGLGLLLYAADFQRNDLGWRSVLGTLSLLYGGLFFVNASPQLASVWWAVLLVVGGTALFFGIGMTAVVRARFSTVTIGREHLIGQQGTADSDLTPSGTVLVDGARWRARSTRAAGIVAGDTVEVVGVDGITLEVDPLAVRDEVRD